MARITVQDCLTHVGNKNRFSLVHLAVKRVMQHRDGHPFLVKCKNKEIVSSLREIATGDVSFDNIKEFDKTKQEPEEKAQETTEPEKETSQTEAA